ncbi:MAG: DUF4340 domain-containing protein [Bacillota bacterium]
MKIKGRGLLVIALLIFGGYAVYDYMKEQKAEQLKTEQSRLLTINFDQVDSIEISRPSDVILLKRTLDGWNLESPVKDQADNTAADDLVKMAASEKILDVAKEGNDIDWAMYGLDKPMGTITFKNSAGQTNSFQIGSKSNFENNPFARRDKEQRVLVVNSSWLTRVQNASIEYRDRRFFRHKMASIDELKLKNKKGLLEIARKEGQWSSVAPKNVSLDQQKVRELIRGISNAKAAQFVEGQLPKASSLFVLDLKLDGKSWSAQVVQAESKKIYATVSDPQFKLEMEPGALDNLINLTIDDLKVAVPKDQKQPSKKDESAQIADKKDK